MSAPRICRALFRIKIFISVSVTNLRYRLSNFRGLVRSVGLRKLLKSNCLLGSRTRDLATCNSASTTKLPRTPIPCHYTWSITYISLTGFSFKKFFKLTLTSGNSIYLSAKSGPTAGPTEPPVGWTLRRLSPGVRRPEREALCVMERHQHAQLMLLSLRTRQHFMSVFPYMVQLCAVFSAASIYEVMSRLRFSVISCNMSYHSSWNRISLSNTNIFRNGREMVSGNIYEGMIGRRKGGIRGESGAIEILWLGLNNL